MKVFPLYLLTILTVLFLSCSTGEIKPVENQSNNPQEPIENPANDTLEAASGYTIQEGSILKDGEIVQPKGVNALNSFGISKDGQMAEWNITIVREFIGNLREQPIAGWPLQDAQGKYLHSLDSIVIEHRKNKRITILCPFGWVDTEGTQTLFTGKNPSETPFYEDYKLKLREIADFFKGQDDVWIQVWNEPYHYNNENGYSHELWLADHEDMVANLRIVPGFDNIILVAGNEQGQSEAVLLDKGAALLAQYDNILFDLHAYGKWNENSTHESISGRLSALKQLQIPFIFGEVGVITEGAPLSNPQNFLMACDNLNIGALAWLWNRNSQDQNALLDDDGAPNTNNNMNWGSMFKTFLQPD